MATDASQRGLFKWLVILGSFWANGCIFSSINNFGIYVDSLHEYLYPNATEHADDVTVKVTLIGTLNAMFTFGFSFISGLLVTRIGLRQAGFCGSLLGLIGLLVATFSDSQFVWWLFYGVVMSIGHSMAYIPSLAILHHYFEDRLALANGLTTSGSAIFTLSLLKLDGYLLNTIGLIWTLRLRVVLFAVMTLLSLTWIPTIPIERSREQRSLRAKLLSAIEPRLWKNHQYVLWIAALSTCMVGYFTPFFHLPTYTKHEVLWKQPSGEAALMMKEGEEAMNGSWAMTTSGDLSVADGRPAAPVDERAAFPLLLLQLCSLASRLAITPLSDRMRCIRKLWLQQAAILLMGVAVATMTLHGSFSYVNALAALLGVFDGVYVSQIGAVGGDLVGPELIGPALGFLMSLFGIAVGIGPIVAAFLYDHLGTYQAAFLTSAAAFVVSFLMLFFVRFRDAPAAGRLRRPDPDVYPAMNFGSTLSL